MRMNSSTRLQCAKPVENTKMLLVDALEDNRDFITTKILVYVSNLSLIYLLNKIIIFPTFQS